MEQPQSQADSGSAAVREVSERHPRPGRQSRTGAVNNWRITAEAVNKLPEPVRQYITQLETLCDPSGMVREITQLKDVIRELEASNVMLRQRLGETR